MIVGIPFPDTDSALAYLIKKHILLTSYTSENVLFNVLQFLCFTPIIFSRCGKAYKDN